MRISLLIPCHNAARYLPRLFAGVNRQTTPFHEVLCYDDNSTDGTADVARSLGARVLPPGGPSTGPAAARNRLAEAAAGDWIHFHDADDLIAEEFAAQLSQVAYDADAVFCDADWLDETSREVLIRWRYDDAALAVDPVSYLIRNPVGINNGMFRRAAFERVGGFNPALTMWEDADLFVRIAGAGARMRHQPGVWTWSLRHTDSFSHDYAASWNYRVTALEDYERQFPEARAAVATEAERAADALTALGDRTGTRRAIALCRRLEHPVPSGGGPLVALARAVVPADVLLRLRHRRRTQT